MKKQILFLAVLFTALFAVMAFTYPVNSGKTVNPPQDEVKALFPQDVQKIFETSCYDCHSDASSNAKGKLKLNFSKWGEMSDAKKVGKMEGINDEVKKGGMPPAKYITNNPGAALSQEQKDLINKWVTEESAKLMGQ